MSAAGIVDAGYAVARPLLFRLEPERAHALVLGLLRAANDSPAVLCAIHRMLGVDNPALAVEAFGLRFPNRVGIAAGLDKNAEAVNAWAALGFGHVEIGTVTPLPQPGNPRPRVFRLVPQRGVINRMGFPNQGLDVVRARLARRRRVLPIVVGGNIGKGIATPLERAVEDYDVAARGLAPVVDYLAVNVSSPNTPGLRQLQAPDHVGQIVRRVRTAGDRPTVLKLAPDMDPGLLPEVVAAAREAGVAGFVATNTTIQREGLVPLTARSQEAGGLSGAPLHALALDFTARLAALAGPDLPIISSGGIFTARDVHERIAAGARLVQVYTGLVYQGPGLAARLLR